MPQKLPVFPVDFDRRIYNSVTHYSATLHCDDDNEFPLTTWRNSHDSRDSVNIVISVWVRLIARNAPNSSGPAVAFAGSDADDRKYRRRRRMAEEARSPPPPTPNSGKIFFGQLSCKIREFC